MAISYVWSLLAAAGGAQVYELLLYCSYVKLWLTLVKYCSQVVTTAARGHRPTSGMIVLIASSDSSPPFLSCTSTGGASRLSAGTFSTCCWCVARVYAPRVMSVLTDARRECGPP